MSSKLLKSISERDQKSFLVASGQTVTISRYSDPNSDATYALQLNANPFNEMEVSFVMHYIQEKKRDSMFDEFDHEHAMNFYLNTFGTLLDLDC